MQKNKYMLNINGLIYWDSRMKCWDAIGGYDDNCRTCKEGYHGIEPESIEVDVWK